MVWLQSEQMERGEQEGFFAENSLQLQYYSYTPLVNFKKHTPKAHYNRIRLKPVARLVQEEYLNRELQNHLTQQFMCKRHQGVVELQKRAHSFDCNISFDSYFESGNLQYVMLKDSVYHLYIRPDTNTKTHFQWFYFKVKIKQPAAVTFVIKNFLKPKMLYREGLRPYHRSILKKQNVFEQIPSNVAFNIAEEETFPQLYELTFRYHFEYANDEVQFCSQPPYTYSRYCSTYKILPFPKIEISKTILGNSIEAFLVNQQLSTGPLVVVMGRQHPGESVGSWMMEGFVNRLMESACPISWVLIPMLNIDGVLSGNNRTGMQGYDFNRHWSTEEETSSFHLFPELKGVISFFKRRKKDFSKRLKMFIDFHGHSSQQNVFAYGPPHYKNSEHYEFSRLFPFLISIRNADFNFGQCSYSLQPQKKNCSRSIFFNKFNFPYSYTIESSFGLYGGKKITQRQMIKMGEDVFLSVVQFLELIGQPSKPGSQLKEMLSKMNEEMQEEQQSRSYDSDSDNEDENDPLRKKFQEKLLGMIASSHSESEDETILDPLSKRKNLMKIGLQSRSKYLKLNGKAEEQRRERFKTEQIRPVKISIRREKSICLPRIKWQSKKESRNQKKSYNSCDLDNLSLQEVKERLINMKHSELGKRILIINRYQSS